MKTERWYRIEALFDQAMRLPESERSGFLDEECADDLALRRELRALVASSQSAGATLRRAVATEVQLLASDVANAHVGRRIGPFRLIGLLGVGGMGSVYLAERDDAQFAQRVAIKILPHTVGSPAAIARFRDERQFLAALEHPNIVRLHDGGSTDDGSPYLVMEYIEGMAITRYADQQQLSVRARVALVRQVCAALQYAHQNLIIHCDIKPSNILVEADGGPKILDFGIAKLLAPVAGSEMRAKTRTGFAVFTPEYASPEQARGDALSTATDVYSVGAVLYELLTGRPPCRTSGSALEILRVICEVDPPRPSTVGPSGRRRELAGDLDNILLKALHKDPARRYASMGQLSDDLRRWLDGLAVAARTPTFGYRARKFVHRHKGKVIATNIMAAALLAATFVSVRQARRADEQAMRAEAEVRNAIDAADRAYAEAERARKAEARVQAQLEEIKAEQAAREAAQAEAREKRGEVERSRERLQVALENAKRAELIAQQESARAREAEARAQAAARAEAAARQQIEVLYRSERERLERVEKPHVESLAR